MPFEDIGTTHVEITLTMRDDGKFDGHRKCGVGCECEFTGSYRDQPTPQGEADSHLCFNDADKVGISGKGCPVMVVEGGPDRFVFTFEAALRKFVADS